MSTEEFVTDIDGRVKAHVNTMRRVWAPDMGLDDRVGYLYVDDHTIAVHVSGQRSLEYYGGFEYIEKDSKTVFGSWVFYFDECSRVRWCLERLQYEQERDHGKDWSDTSLELSQ